MSIKALSDKVVITRQEDGTIGVDIDESKILHQKLSGVGKNNHASLDDHVGSNLNPHSTRAAQTGAVTGSDKNKPNGVAGLDRDGKLSEKVIPQSVAKYSDVADHRNSTANPHKVTPEQIGAVSAETVGRPDGIASLDGKGRLKPSHLPDNVMLKGSLDDHNSRADNPHKVTAVQAGAIPSYEKGRPFGVAALGGDGLLPEGVLPASVAKENKLASHINDEGNPHKLNAAQVGAISIFAKGIPEGVAPLDKHCRIKKEYLPDGVVFEFRLAQHEGSVGNPHKVTAEQIGAVHTGQVGEKNGVASLDTNGALHENQVPGYLVDVGTFREHAYDGDNPHTVTAEQVKAVPEDKVGIAGGVAPLGSDARIPEEYMSHSSVNRAEFVGHLSNRSNPHGVTPEQIGSVAYSTLGTPRGPASLDEAGNLHEGQLPLSVVRREQLDAHLRDENPHGVDHLQVGSEKPLWNASRLRGLSLPYSTPTDGDIVRWSEEDGSFIYDQESMVGEVNKAANTGYGVPFYMGKEDDCLIFRTLARTKSALISLETDEEDNHETIWIDLNEHNINHSKLKESGQRKHSEIDSHLDSTGNPHRVTAKQVGNSVAQWNANKILDRDVSTQSPSDGQVLKWDARAKKWVPSNEAASDAESNDALNVGNRGVGIFKRKKDAVLEFKKLLSTNNRLSIKADEKNSVVTFTINEETMSHDKMAGAGKNSHKEIDAHIHAKSNPHNVTSDQVGRDRPEWNANRLNGVFVETSDLRDGDVLIFSAEENKLIPCNIRELVRQVMEEC